MRVRWQVRGVGWLAWMLVMAVVMAGSVGCNVTEVMGGILYQTAPRTEKVDAEYTGLEGRKTLVYVWIKPEMQWDYPEMRLDIAAHLSAYLKENIKKIEVIPAPQVEARIKSLSTMNLDPADLAHYFHADQVVHVSIYKFSMRDPGMAQFYRGRISGSVVVLDLSVKDEPAKRVPLKDVVVAVPEGGPGAHESQTSADQLRELTYREFVLGVGRKFHPWEREKMK